MVLLFIYCVCVCSDVMYLSNNFCRDVDDEKFLFVVYGRRNKRKKLKLDSWRRDKEYTVGFFTIYNSCCWLIRLIKPVRSCNSFLSARKNVATIWIALLYVFNKKRKSFFFQKEYEYIKTLRMMRKKKKKSQNKSRIEILPVVV